jgi:RNA polymerase subunit RPABC4/transcription elongation factor Spt4
MATDSHSMSCLNCGHEIHEDARFCARCGAPQAGARDRGLAIVKTPLLSGNQYVRALRRFWWVLVLGLGIAAIAAIAAVYRIDFFSVPPSLEKRAQITYTSSARLLVTSAEAPYYRTTVTREISGEGDATTQEFAGAPDIGTLISAANLYPILIESDEVQELRQEMSGPLPGSVTTRAIYEVNSPSRFELSQVPVVEVFGFADTYAGAVEITQATVDAFMVYVDRTQDEAGLRRQERIFLEMIQRPEDAIASGGSSLSLPLMLFVVIAAAFFALAILLDRLFPLGFGLPRRWRPASQRADETGIGEPSSEPEPQTRRSKAQV